MAKVVSVDMIVVRLVAMGVVVPGVISPAGRVMVRLAMGMRRVRFMVMVMVMIMIMITMGMLVLQVNIELCPRDLAAFLSANMKVVAIEAQFLQLGLKPHSIHTQVQQGPDKHVSAQPTEDVQVKCFHESWPAASALIWLAA